MDMISRKFLRNKGDTPLKGDVTLLFLLWPGRARTYSTKGAIYSLNYFESNLANL